MTVADLFGDTSMPELFIDLVVASDELKVVGTEGEMPVVAVLVIKVEFSDGVVVKDNVLFKICVTFLDITVVELFKVCVRIGKLKVEVGRKGVVWLLKLAKLDDWTTVLLNSWLDAVKLMLTLGDGKTVLFGEGLDTVKLTLRVEDWIVLVGGKLNTVELMLASEDSTAVLFGATLDDISDVDNLTVELTLKVTVLEVITIVDILESRVGGALVAVGVGVFPIPPAALLTLCLAMFF